MGRVAHSKLYLHQDKYVELEFRNAYKRIAAAGERGPQGDPGPAGPAGANGVDGNDSIGCLKRFLQQGVSPIATPGSYVITVGTLPANHIVFDVYMYMWDWRYAGSRIYNLGHVSDNDYYATYTLPIQSSFTGRIWPVSSFYTTPVEWLGKAEMLQNPRDVLLSFTLDVTNATSFLFICVRYTTVQGS